MLATALRPLPDALDRAMRALAMARTVADGAPVVDQSSSGADATSEPAAAECEDAGALTEDTPELLELLARVRAKRDRRDADNTDTEA